MNFIGIPRRIPNEFKARNQIAAGCELASFRWSTTNKNVDWINYTRDALKGIAEQLDATSRLAWGN